MGAFLIVECPLVRVAGLRGQRERHRARDAGQQDDDNDYGALKPAPPDVRQRLHPDRFHEDTPSSARTRITSSVRLWVVTSRTSSTTWPSMTLITRDA